MDGQIERLRFHSHLHNDFVDAAVEEDHEAIRRAQDKVAQNLPRKSFHVLYEHRLALPNCPDHLVYEK